MIISFELHSATLKEVVFYCLVFYRFVSLYTVSQIVFLLWLDALLLICVIQDLAHAVLAKDKQLVEQILQKKCAVNVNLKNLVGY